MIALPPFRELPDAWDARIGRWFAIAGVASVVVRATEVVRLLPLYAIWWVMGGCVLLALLIVAAIAGRRTPRWIRRALWILIPTLTIVMHFTSAAAHAGIPEVASFPLSRLLSVASICMVTLWLSPLAAMAVGALSAIAAALGSLVLTGTVAEPVLQLTPLMLTGVGFVALMVGTRSQLYRLKVAQELAEQRRREELAARVLALAHRQTARSVHDTVLATLTAATRFSGSVPQGLIEDAHSTLGALREGFAVQADAITSAQLGGDIADEIASIVGSVTVASTIDDVEVPSAAAAAITMAASEAARNIAKHAPDSPRPLLNVQINGSGVVVRITDFGPGFETTTSPSTRLGIAESIVGRMRDAGGVATVTSVIGVGTTIELRSAP